MAAWSCPNTLCPLFHSVVADTNLPVRCVCGIVDFGDRLEVPDRWREAVFTPFSEFSPAARRWDAAGRPARTDEEVRSLFVRHCSVCDAFDGRSCGVIEGNSRNAPVDNLEATAATASLLGGCAKRLANNLRMATEGCPLQKWGTDQDAITIGITSFLRPDSLRRCLVSIERYYPQLRVEVEDTGGNLSHRYKHLESHRMDRSRNRLHPSSYFDHIYCLSLDRQRSRRAVVEQRLSSIEIRPEWFPAIDGELRPINAIFNSDYELRGLSTPGELGCLLSYRKLIADAMASGYQRILVFEDDICLHRDFLKLFQGVCVLRERWKLLYLGCSQHQWRVVRYSHDSFYHACDSQGSFAFAIDRSLFSELLELLHEGTSPVDRCLTRIQDAHPDRCFVFSPNLVIADVRQSDIREPRDLESHAMRMRWDLSHYHIPLAPPNARTRNQTTLESSSIAALPPCGFRESLADTSDRFHCGYPRVHAAGNFVDAHVCGSCRWAGKFNAPATNDTDTVDATGSRPVLPQHMAPAVANSSNGPWNWALGVTTAPRRRPTVTRCLRSLKAAGWDTPHVFSEPGVRLSAEFAHLPRTVRQKPLGAFPNW